MTTEGAGFQHTMSNTSIHFLSVHQEVQSSCKMSSVKRNAFGTGLIRHRTQNAVWSTVPDIIGTTLTKAPKMYTSQAV